MVDGMIDHIGQLAMPSSGDANPRILLPVHTGFQDQRTIGREFSQLGCKSSDELNRQVPVVFQRRIVGTLVVIDYTGMHTVHQAREKFQHMPDVLARCSTLKQIVRLPKRRIIHLLHHGSQLPEDGNARLIQSHVKIFFSSR